MQVDKKYAQQLSLAIDERQHTTRAELGRQTHYAKQAVSFMAKGDRKTQHEAKKSFGKVLKDIRLAFSAGRADFGTISYMDDKRVSKDLFAVTQSADKEEQDTLSVKDAAFLSAAVPPRQRTKRDWENIKAYAKERPEEIGAEITELITYCEYVGIDVKDIIAAFNEQLGG